MTNGTTKADATRIQSSQAKGGGDMTSGGFAARAQRAADRNEAAPTGVQRGTNTSDGPGQSAKNPNSGGHLPVKKN